MFIDYCLGQLFLDFVTLFSVLYILWPSESPQVVVFLICVTLAGHVIHSTRVGYPFLDLAVL